MKKYFYSDGTSSFGPFTLEELRGENISKDTLIWYHELEKWEKAESIQDLKNLFTLVPPPILKQDNITQQHIRSNSWNSIIDILVFISIVYWFFHETISLLFLDDIVEELLRKDVVNYYSFSKYLIFSFIPIIIALSVNNKTLKIIAIVFSVINFIYMSYIMIDWIIRV